MSSSDPVRIYSFCLSFKNAYSLLTCRILEYATSNISAARSLVATLYTGNSAD